MLARCVSIARVRKLAPLRPVEILALEDGAFEEACAAHVRRLDTYGSNERGLLVSHRIAPERVREI